MSTELDTLADAPVGRTPMSLGALIGDAVTAVAVALSGLGMAISMAALIFAGPLEPTLPRAIAAFVFAGALASAVTAWRSGFIPVAAIIQDGPAVVLVAVAATVGASGAPASDVILLVVVSTFLTGAVMWAMGHFGLGGMVRYVPTTVVGAFVAGTGWLLTKGGVDVMVGFGVGLDDIDELVSADLLGRWVPGVALGVALWLIGRSDRLPPVAMSATILLSGVAFFVVTALASSVDAVESGGWLIGPFPTDTGLSLLSASEVGDADWGGLIAVLPGIFTVVAVAVLALLLNVTGLESISGTRVDVDDELRLAGAANVLLAPLGAAPGFIGIAGSVLLGRMGATRRAVAISGATLMGLFGFFGLQIIGYVPRLVVGALLVTVGVALLAEWIEGLVRMVSRVEQLLSISILLVIAFVGILEGIGAGVVAACAVFIVRYSRIDPIRRSGGGHGMRSRVDRSPAEVATLTASADRLAVFELQGYLFFGSLTTLGERVRTSLDGGEVDVLVLDFRSVSGVDTSGYQVISDVVRSATAVGADVTISHLDGDIRDALRASDPDVLSVVSWTRTLDEALEWTEQIQLDRSDASGDTSIGATIDAATDSAVTDSAVAVPAVSAPRLSYTLSAEFSDVTFASGATVMRQGDDSDGMFVVVDGTLTAYRVERGGQRHRLRRFGAGAMIGEIGMVTREPRSAEIVADTEVHAIELSRENYELLRRNSPDLAFELHEYIMKGQASRVVSLSEGVARLSE